MRRLLLPFFIVRLSLSLVPFVATALITYLSPFRTLIITLFFFAYFSLLLFSSLTQKKTALLVMPESTLAAELDHWLKLAELQPTHRDVLINASLLYSAQGDEVNARKFLKKAREIDPNHQFFTQSEK